SRTATPHLQVSSRQRCIYPNLHKIAVGYLCTPQGVLIDDALGMLYQQMRHLELTYGPDDSSYQNLTSTVAPTTTTQPRALPTTPIVYLPAGPVPVPCDPRLNPTLAAPSKTPPAPFAPKKSDPPPPRVITVKGIEYECDPYWDPDCLSEHPPHPIPKTHSCGHLLKRKPLCHYFDPYDFKQDLYDPFYYVPEQQ
uniref:Actinodin3 n=1 Tax=Amphilophus citrinellus TaxID=61819 RepID=A0A3Q0SXV6_AMPCI